MKIYIAGPMTGYKDFNRPSFRAFALKLSLDGHVVLNPAVLPDGLTQPQYMDICLAMLRSANAIYLLDGWEKSAGARAEKALAEKLALEIIYQSEE
ncbi:TPA: DUF4406 domain-containing protein [Kluyvera georgiana]